MTFKDWLNGTSMTSLKQLTSMVGSFIGSMILTIVCARLLLRGPGDFVGKVPFATDPKKLADAISIYLAMSDSYVKSCQTTGLILAASLFALWGVSKGIDTIQHGKDRDTSREKVEAEARGKETARLQNGGPKPPALQVVAEHAEVNQEVADGSVRSGE